MNNRLLPVAALALLLLAGGFWFLTRGSSERGAERAARTQPTAESNDGGTASSALTLEEPAAEEPEVAAATGSTETTRSVATTDYENELNAGHWVEGRVVFPADTPADEKVRVVANGRSFEYGPDHEVEVGADGRFRVSFSERTTRARLQLKAEYLYLPESYRLEIGKVEGPIVLEPVLGGALGGRVLTPEDDPEARSEVVGRRVELHGRSLDDDNRWDTKVRRVAVLDESLTYSFGALPLDARYEISLDAGAFEPAEIDEVLVEAGAALTFDLTVLRGSSFIGRVVDEDGEPVNGAQVRTEVQSGGPWSRGQWRNTISKEDGAFALEGVTPGDTKLKVTARGYEEFTREFGDVARGEVRGDLTLTLVRGNSIRGVVLRPDGEPAAGATVKAEAESGENWSLLNQNFRADDEGAFAVEGLEPGIYRITASYVHKEKKLVVSELTGKERKKTVRTTLRHTVTNVEAGTGDLVLRVNEGMTLAGSVVDDLGAPVGEYKLIYGRQVQNGQHSYVRRTKTRKVEDAAGVFEISGLEPGTYKIDLEAGGFVPKEDVTVELPMEEVLAPIVMTRAMRVSGIVLTPSGEPVADAAIEVWGAGQPVAHFGFGGVSGKPFRQRGQSKSNGEFELDEVSPGAIEVRANATGYAPSEPVAIELGPGEASQPLTLRVGAGVRLTGVVVDAAGNGIPRRLVKVDLYGGPFRTTVQTNAEGAFELGGIEPGKYKLTAPPTSEELADAGLEDLDGVRDMLAREETVEVDYSGAHVVMRPPQLNALRLHGTITGNGKPIEANLYVYEEGSNGVSTKAGSDGTYEVALPRPGSYGLSLRLGSSANSYYRFEATGNEHRFDIDLELGAIHGRVMGPDGPLKGISVSANRTADAAGDQAMSSSSAKTDGNGEFELDPLLTGTWTIQAGGANDADASRSFTEASLEGLVVNAGDTVTGADLVLTRGASIRGRVTSDGNPIGGARLMLRDPEGQIHHYWGITQSDGSGEYEIFGLAPGTYALAATSEVGCSDEETVVLVGAEDRELDFELRPGTVLTLQAEGLPEENAFLQASLMRDGKDFGPWVQWNASGSGSGKLRVGPLPPGTYAVNVGWGELTSPEQTVTLSGEPERTLTFELVESE